MLAWITRNWADTDEGNDSGLAPVDVLLSPPEVLARIEAVIAQLPLWKVEKIDGVGTVHATRTTRLFRFVDDITIRLEPIPTGTLIHARSKSRVGIGDFGQNRRNLLEFLGPLRP